MHEPTGNRRRAAAPRWAGLVAAAVLVAGLTACGSLLDGLTPDTEAPDLSLSGLTDGDIVATSEVTITAVATDDRNVTSVRYAVNGGASNDCAFVGGDTWWCTSVRLEVGANTVVVAARDDAGNATPRSRTVYYQPPASASEFNVEIVFFEESFTASQKQAFQIAVDKWRSVIVGDVLDVDVDVEANTVCSGDHPALATTVDDLVIFATSFDGVPGGELASAGPCLARGAGSDQGTPSLALMRFDTTDLAQLEAQGDLVETVIHEMGHALGLGILWESIFYDLLDYAPRDAGSVCTDVEVFSTPPRYLGTSGVAAWQEDLGGSGGVPVEDEHGPGTRCGHWDEATFDTELMTGILNASAFNPLSVLTVRALEDIGFTVDPSASEPYELPSAAALRAQDGFDIAAAETLLRPRGTIAPETGEVTFFPVRQR